MINDRMKRTKLVQFQNNALTVSKDFSKLSRMHHITHKFLIVFGLSLLAATFCKADSGEKILFLHMNISSNAVTLVQSSVRPGKVKTAAHGKKGRLYLELTSTNGLTLWSDVIPDPTTRRFEYEDPDHPGNLKVKVTTTKQAELTVRIPFHSGAKDLKIFRLNQIADRSKTMALRSSMELIGTIILPEIKPAP